MTRARHSFPTLVLTCLIAAGCASARTVPLAKSVAARGQEVATAALAFYYDVDATLARDKAQQDFIKILRAPAGSDFPDSQRQDFSAQLKSRRAAYQALKVAYGRYQALADSSAPSDVATATGGLVDAANSLGNAPRINPQARALLGIAGTKFVEAQRSRKLQKQHAALVELVNAYRTVWIDDAEAWKEMLTGVEVMYTSGIAGIPPTSFDAAKIMALVPEPVAADRRVPLYQLGLINAERGRTAASQEKMQAVSRALDALVAAHAALASDKPSFADVVQSSNQILDALKRNTP